MYEWYFLLLLFLLGGGVPVTVTLIRRTFSSLSGQRVVVQYTHVFTEEERNRVNTWSTYKYELENACVETWLSSVGRGHDLKGFRRYNSEDRRLKAELGLSIIDASVGQKRVPVGTLLILTMRPNVEAVPALETVLSHLGWYPVEHRFPKEDVSSLLESDEEVRQVDGPES